MEFYLSLLFFVMSGQFGLRAFIRQAYGQQLAASVNCYFSLVKKHATLLNQQIAEDA